MKRVCLYFGVEDFSIVEVAGNGERIGFEKAFSLPLSELDNFLSTTKYDDFIISCNFSDLKQEIITVPALGKKYLKRVISLEVKKLSEGRDYTYVYYDLGERIIEQKRMKDISIIMVNKKEINDLIERFLRFKKSVSHIYSSIQSALALLRNDKRTLICVFETSGAGYTFEKNIFLMKDNKPIFFRRLASFNKGLSDIDIKGIEMSVAHSQQSLRIQPEGVILIGDFGEPLEDSIKGLPVSSIRELMGLDIEKSDLRNYLIPLGSAMCSEQEDLLTDDYRAFSLTKSVVRASIIAFYVLSVLFILISLVNIKEIISIRNERQLLEEDEKRLSGIMSEYRDSLSRARSLERIVNFLKEQRFFPSRVFNEFSRLRLNNIEFTSLEMDLSGNAIMVKILGRVRAQDYTIMLESYNNLIEDLKGIKGTEIVSKGFRLVDGTFNLDVRFNDIL